MILRTCDIDVSTVLMANLGPQGISLADEHAGLPDEAFRSALGEHRARHESAARDPALVSDDPLAHLDPRAFNQVIEALTVYRAARTP